MNTIIVLATVVITAVRPAPAPLCPSNSWRASSVQNVNVRTLEVCK